MPLREFRCKECDAISEVLIRNPEDEKNVACRSCGSRKVEKLLSAAAVAVKEGASEFGPAQCGQEVRCCGRTTPCDTPACQR